MKFFKKEYFLDEIEDSLLDKAFTEYDEYIEKNFSKFPVVLKILSKHIFLHDGILKQVVYEKNKGLLIFEYICGDLQFGYFGLKISYELIKKFKSSFLIELFNDKEMQILYDEIEILNQDIFEHRVLYENGSETTITFKKASITIWEEMPESFITGKCKVIIK